MKKIFPYKLFLLLPFLLIFSSTYANQSTPQQSEGVLCYLEKGYHLPKNVEFAERCQDTDLPADKMLWLVQNTNNPIHGKYGFVNSHGEIVIPLQYQRANSFHEGLAVVDIDYDKSGYLDKTGKLIIPADYEMASDFHDGLAAVKKNGKVGFINQQNEVELPFIYANADHFENGFASATLTGNDQEWGVIDKTGKTILPFEYAYISRVMPNKLGWYFRVTKDDQEMMLDKQGKIVFPKYDSIGFFADGLVNVKKGEKWGFVTAKNEPKIDFMYDDATGFFGGLALVQKGDKYGFINPQGEVVIPLIYDKINQPFYDFDPQTMDTVTAQKHGKFYFLHKDGSAMPLDFDKVGDYMDGIHQDLLVVANQDTVDPNEQYYGVIDKHGKIIIPLKYRYINFSATGLYQYLPTVVTFDEHSYVLNLKGEIVADKTAEYHLMKYY